VPVFLSENALIDLSMIAAFIGKSSLRNAETFLHRVEVAVHRIDREPTAYPIRDDLPVAGLRTRSEPPCIIVFRVRKRNELEIVRIAHDRQDLAALLRAAPKVPNTS
jgi:plasmid stabilization system protein ParE